MTGLSAATCDGTCFQAENHSNCIWQRMAAGSWLAPKVGAEAYLEPDLAKGGSAARTSRGGQAFRHLPSNIDDLADFAEIPPLGPRQLSPRRQDKRSGSKKRRRAQLCRHAPAAPPRPSVQSPNVICDFILAVRESGSPSSPSSPKLRMVGPLRHTTLACGRQHCGYLISTPLSAYRLCCPAIYRGRLCLKHRAGP